MIKPTLFQKYGPVALVTYSAISAISYPSWVAAIHFGVDVSSLLQQFQRAKASIGFESSPETSSQLPSQSTNWGELGTTLLMAMAAHKIIFPLRIGLTALLTPRFSRLLLARGIDLNAMVKRWRR